MKCLLMMCAAVSLCACSPAPKSPPQSASASTAVPAPSTAAIPAGDYHLDPMHASLSFDVSHMGFSHYTARFSQFDAQLKLDPTHPESASLTATVDPTSLVLNAPPKGFHDELMGKSWLDAKAFPAITFTSTKIVKTGADTATIEGNLTLRDITKPITLSAKYNGGYPGLAVYDPNARIGFSATGTFKRSDFGISYGIPAAGTTLGVSDEVHVVLETEFTGPPLKSTK